MNIKKIEKLILDISIKIAKQGKGCLFVIKEKELDYENLIEQDLKPFSIFDNERRLEALALIDGACVINLKGELIAYSVQISNTKTFPGFGTRHAAAYTASLKGNTVIMSSEEDRKVRIFKNGKIILQVDALERKIENRTKEIVSVFESIGFGTVVSIGVTAFAPAVGIALIPGILIFGSPHFIIKLLKKGK